MNRPQNKPFYLFGVFRIDVIERVLYRDNCAIPLTPKAFDTLLTLVENCNHTLAKRELINKIWPDSFVEENNLAQNISILRRALGKGLEGQDYIQTVPKRGYRFVADVKEAWEEDAGVVVRERTRARVVIEEEVDELPIATSGLSLPPADREAEFNIDRIPETQYAVSGDVNIAYQVVGDAARSRVRDGLGVTYGVLLART